MKHSLKRGFSFGLTSGIITTLGLIVGLHSGTKSRLAVIGGILIIAISDAFSDALGIHISDEFENRHSSREIWEATVSTFIFKFICALSFVVPILLFEFSIAIVFSIIWGLSILSILSYRMATSQKVNHWRVIAEHLIIASLVILLSHYIGDWISKTFC
ncbi:MAG: hypothetical protein SVZ03_11095 [Spirochaetota bacterium]|nr:hypothetical protein [Spirochaetota bacterium]